MSKFQVSPGVMLREIDGEIVAFDSRVNLIHQLNGIASLIWRLATEGNSPDSIVEAIVAEHDVDRNAVLKDVDEMLVRLQSIGLIRLVLA